MTKKKRTWELSPQTGGQKIPSQLHEQYYLKLEQITKI